MTSTLNTMAGNNKTGSETKFECLPITLNWTDISDDGTQYERRNTFYTSDKSFAEITLRGKNPMEPTVSTLAIPNSKANIKSSNESQSLIDYFMKHNPPRTWVQDSQKGLIHKIAWGAIKNSSNIGRMRTEMFNYQSSNNECHVVNIISSNYIDVNFPELVIQTAPKKKEQPTNEEVDPNEVKTFVLVNNQINT